MKKHDHKKEEKEFYQPGTEPVLVVLPEMGFFTIEGRGNPNDESFREYIQVLYSLSYTVKMSPKQGNAPEGYFDYTVYPLEGIWDLSEEAKSDFSGKIDKNQLVFKLMIRQPDFVSPRYASGVIELTQRKKPHPLLEKVKFERLEEGRCIQMLHIGTYDSEPASFRKMEEFAQSRGLCRLSRQHREIYLSDPRKTAPEKLRTVLRFRIKQ
jgi:hypothetical protein